MSQWFYHYSGGMPVWTLLLNMLSTFFSLGVSVLLFISRWFVFKKMGLPGWKGIIPFYGDLVLFRTVWNVRAFWAYVIGMIVFVGVYGAGLMVLLVYAMYMGLLRSEPSSAIMIPFYAVMGFVFVAFVVYELVITFKLYRRLANAFGKSAGFAAGLTFLTPIFLPVLAFGKAQYKGNPSQS